MVSKLVNFQLTRLDVAVSLNSMADFAGGQEDVLALFLFGSYGMKWQTVLSDVDLAVLPMPETS
ncbi:hypothetical protein MOOTH_12640 [Moorella thermoacetica]|nr:hypothetical protein MOOTH_12640 [Moorella thermoacetica]